MLRAFSLRFALVYVVLYGLPFPIDVIVATRVEVPAWYATLWDPVVNVVAGWFQIDAAVSVADNGSGDRLGNYLHVLCLLVIAAALAGVWTFIDRRRQRPDLLDAFRIWARYLLAASLLGYGMIKVIPMQFPLPNPGGLLSRVGEMTPMRLLWTFMGESPMYVRFAGAAEVLGGLLLLWRRTATLGAAIGAGVMAQVVALNLCYDVCVKLFSLHLLLLALVLLVPEAERLVRFFVLNRPVEPADLRPVSMLGRRPWLHRVLKTMVLGVLFYSAVVRTLQAYGDNGDGQPRAPLYGWYEVTALERGGVTPEPRFTDPALWRQVAFGNRSVTIQFADDHRESVRYTYDAATGELAFPQTKVVFQVERSGDRLVLRGPILGQPSTITLVPSPKNRLRTRGFHWVNEVPYNR